MKTRSLSLCCTLVLSVLSLPSYAQANTSNLFPEVTSWEAESEQTYSDIEAAISKLPPVCQQASTKYKEQYGKITELLLNSPKLPQEAKQILFDTKSSLAWGIQAFRQGALHGEKLNAEICTVNLSSLNSIEQQLKQITRVAR